MPRLTIIAGVLALAGLAAGCAKKVTVAESFTTPEGIPTSTMQLMTFYDLPNQVYVIKDKRPLSEANFSRDSTSDSLYILPDGTQLGTSVQAFSPGTVRGEVLSMAAIEGVQVFRSEPNGAVRPVLDFAAQPEERWLDRLSESYTFSDGGRGSGTKYIARGLVGGVGGPTSPLSNFSHPSTQPLVEIKYLATRFGTPVGQQPFQAESTFFMQWTQVPGAASYLIHVFQFLPGTTVLDKAIGGAPGPYQSRRTLDILLASVPGNVTSYRYGNPGAVIYTERIPHLNQEYFVRIAAIGSSGEMLGLTTGPVINTNADLLKIQDERDYTLAPVTATTQAYFGPVPADAYYYFGLNAVRVSPGEKPAGSSRLVRSRDR